jgi:hypothetical protein
MQGIFTAVVRRMDPSKLTGDKCVSLTWTRKFMRIHCGMTYKRSTEKTNKLPLNFEEQKRNMVYRVAYFVKMADTPLELIVNSDQTGIYMVPNAGTMYYFHNYVLFNCQSNIYA